MNYAILVLRFPDTTSDDAVKDIAHRIGESLQDDLSADGNEVFGNECPKVEMVLPSSITPPTPQMTATERVYEAQQRAKDPYYDAWKKGS